MPNQSNAPTYSKPQSFIVTTKHSMRYQQQIPNWLAFKKDKIYKEYQKEEQTYKRKALKNSTFRTPFLSSP